MSDHDQNEIFDASRRRLCPDGSCIGVLDQNGRCKECGKTGGVAGVGAVPEPRGADETTVDMSADDAGVDDETSGQEAGSFQPNRALCPDGACVGVIGADGRCKVCGRSQEA